MKYVLHAVYQAAALDEIYRALQDEFDLSLEDLHSLRETLHDLGDVPITELKDQGGNLNLTPVQDTLKSRISVLEAKVTILYTMTRIIENDCQVVNPLIKRDIKSVLDEVDCLPDCPF
jgi:hypothetical protein